MEVINKVKQIGSVIELNDSLIELKMIGAILVNGNSVELQLKNAKYIKYNMDRELSLKLQDIWLGELDRRNIETKRCSKKKEPSKSLSDAIIQGVLKGLKDKEVDKRCSTCKYGSGFSAWICPLCINNSEWRKDKI